MSDEDLDLYWSEISKVFKLCEISPSFGAPSPSADITILSESTMKYLVINPDVATFVEDFVLDAYNIKLREQLVPHFWGYFLPSDISSEKIQQMINIPTKPK